MKRNHPSSLQNPQEGDHPAEGENLPSLDPEEPSDLDDIDPDDDRWDAFLADEDELDPTPAPGDFWQEND
jgi:hypothetical protein